MRDVIAELRELARHDESEFTPGAKGYRAIDEMAVELEVAELIHSIVRSERPGVVVESGAGRGYSTLAIAGALERNQHGYLWSYEDDPEYVEVARNRVGDMSHVSVLCGDSRDHGDDASMVFLDSGPEKRLAEIKYWLFRPVTLLVHDAWRYEEALAKMGGQMFGNPRGLWLRLRDWSTLYGPMERHTNG